MLIRQNDLKGDSGHGCINEAKIAEIDVLGQRTKDMAAQMITISDKLDMILMKEHMSSSYNKEIAKTTIENESVITNTTIDESVKCDLCTYVSYHQSDLRRHMNIMHKVPLSCNRCQKEFMQIDNLKNHIKEDHRPSRVFYSSNWNRKANKQRPEHQIRTSIVRNSFEQEKTIVNENETVANNSIPDSENDFMDECPFKCTHRPKVFKQKDEFLIHMEFYHSDQPLKRQ